jgi:small redox-active disulfide protein 2
MDVKVLGPGCMKCNKLYEEARKAIDEAGVEATLEKVEGIHEIADHGVMFPPALVIDGEVKSSGSVLKAAKIAALLREAVKG